MLWTICVLGRVELNGYNVPSAAGMRAKMNAKNNAFVSEILARLKTAKDTADTGVIMLWILDNINQSPAAQDDDKNVGDAQDDTPEDDTPEDDTPEDDTPEDDADKNVGDGGDAQDDDAPEDDDAEDWTDPNVGDAQDDDTGGGLADPGAEDDDAPGGDVGTGGVGDDADDAIDWKTNDADDLEDTEPNVADVTEQIGTDVYNAEVLNSVLSRAVVSREIQTEAAIHGNGDRLEDYKDGVPVPSKLKTQIRSIVSAPGRVDKRRWQENGRLDLRAVPAMRCGARNVYKRRRKTEAVQSVVSLLIDLSHSMNGRRRIGAAVGLAGHLGECLKAAGVSFEIMGFKGSDKSYAIKTLSEPWNVSAMANVATSANAANGQTNISSAIVRASQRLRGVQNVTRRIVLVLTDGDCGYGPRAVKASIKYAETIGVETAGIGLQNDVSGVFPVSQSVFDVADLARDGLGVLAKTLGRAR
jgi:cobalamin biosynthesis protein CobT